MSICQIEEREAGRSYPRTCPTCRLGPCSRGHDYKSMREQIAAQAAEIERLREMTRKQAHEYLALDMQAGEALARATQAAEIERLTRERDAERRARMVAHEHYESRTLEADRAHAKAIRDLRAQADGHDARATAAEAKAGRMEEVAEWFVRYAEGAPVHRGEADEMLAKARAALTERKP